jgi:hypothetical protein
MPLQNHAFPSRDAHFSRVEAYCDWYYVQDPGYSNEHFVCSNVLATELSDETIPTHEPSHRSSLYQYIPAAITRHTRQLRNSGNRLLKRYQTAGLKNWLPIGLASHFF